MRKLEWMPDGEKGARADHEGFSAFIENNWPGWTVNVYWETEQWSGFSLSLRGAQRQVHKERAAILKRQQPTPVKTEVSDRLNRMEDFHL